MGLAAFVALASLPAAAGDQIPDLYELASRPRRRAMPPKRLSPAATSPAAVGAEQVGGQGRG